MKVNSCTYRPIYKVETLSQTNILDAIDNFIFRTRRLNIKFDAIYPADPCAFPFAMYISGKTGTPIKQEKFIKSEEKVLMVFSIFPDQIKKPGINFLTPKYITEKIKVFRKQFPKSPSLLIASNNHIKDIDIQLIIHKKHERVNSYKFLIEAYKNFYFPVEGEFLHIEETFWKISRQEIGLFEKAKRIRDNAMKLGYDDIHTDLIPLEEDVDILYWEKFEKLKLYRPETKQKETEENFKIKYRKLLDLKNKEDSSVIASILETISQTIEPHFPVRVAYTNYEIVHDRKVLIVPVAREIVDGVELKIEISHIKAKPSEEKLLTELVENALKTLVKDILKHKTFRPYVEIVKEKDRLFLYINWFLDREVLNLLSERINKKWLLARLFYRKKAVSRKNELIKNLQDFKFSLENLTYLFSAMESLYAESPVMFKAVGNKMKEILEEKNLWYLIGIYALKCFGYIKIDGIAGNKELLQFLLKLKNYENFHQFFALENRYVFPVITERKYRPNWERVIKTDEPIVLTREVLNPQTPVTYTIKDSHGFFLGTVPKVVAHYIAAKEETGKKLTCEKFFLDETMFSGSSYWIEVTIDD
ncbi:hypothetical protein [Desulfurobacterium sp.]